MPRACRGVLLKKAARLAESSNRGPWCGKTWHSGYFTSLDPAQRLPSSFLRTSMFRLHTITTVAMLSRRVSQRPDNPLWQLRCRGDCLHDYRSPYRPILLSNGRGRRSNVAAQAIDVHGVTRNSTGSGTIGSVGSKTRIRCFAPFVGLIL